MSRTYSRSTPCVAIRASSGAVGRSYFCRASSSTRSSPTPAIVIWNCSQAVGGGRVDAALGQLGDEIGIGLIGKMTRALAIVEPALTGEGAGGPHDLEV